MVIKNPTARKYVYAACIAIIAAATVFGVVKPEQLEAGVSAASQVAGLLAAILAVLNVPTGGGES